MKECPECGCEYWYNPLHDAYYCPWCIVWKEKVCNGTECKYCKNRPVRPFPNSAHAKGS